MESMNREQKRALKKRGDIDDEGEPTRSRRQAPSQRPSEARPTVRQYLREVRVPTVMGFDPMMQFIHEEDLCEAIALALEQGLQGVFNVAGPGEVPLHTAIQETGGTPLPMPEFLMRPLFSRLYRMGMLPYPPGAIDYLKFPVTVSGDRFVDATNFRCTYGLEEIFHSVRR